MSRKPAPVFQRLDWKERATVRWRENVRLWKAYHEAHPGEGNPHTLALRYSARVMREIKRDARAQARGDGYVPTLRKYARRVKTRRPHKQHETQTVGGDRWDTLKCLAVQAGLLRPNSEPAGFVRDAMMEASMIRLRLAVKRPNVVRLLFGKLPDSGDLFADHERRAYALDHYYRLSSWDAHLMNRVDGNSNDGDESAVDVAMVAWGSACDYLPSAHYLTKY